MQTDPSQVPTAKSPRIKQDECKKLAEDDFATAEKQAKTKFSTEGSAESKMGPLETSTSTLTEDCGLKALSSLVKKSAKAETVVHINLPADLRASYTARTVEALNQFSKYTRYTPTEQLDLRCEFDLPRFKNLSDTKPISTHDDHQNFLWFQRSRDFTTPSNPKKEATLRLQIINLTIHDLKLKASRELKKKEVSEVKTCQD